MHSRLGGINICLSSGHLWLLRSLSIVTWAKGKIFVFRKRSLSWWTSYCVQSGKRVNRGVSLKTLSGKKSLFDSNRKYISCPSGFSWITIELDGWRTSKREMRNSKMQIECFELMRVRIFEPIEGVIFPCVRVLVKGGNVSYSNINCKTKYFNWIIFSIRQSKVQTPLNQHPIIRMNNVLA